MKVYSIGREEGCDIVIDDNTDVISRRHAAINVSTWGKMTITDYSHNGTYVNGIRIAQNVPVPVTRKDNISFSHVSRLDWNKIPNTQAMIIRYVIIGIVALLVIIGGVVGYKSCSSGNGNQVPDTSTAVVDSTGNKADNEMPVAGGKQKEDSLKNEVKDSTNKVRQQPSEKKQKKSVDSPKGSKNNNSAKKEESKKEEPQKKRFR